MSLKYDLLPHAGVLQHAPAPLPDGGLTAPSHIVELIPEVVARENTIFPLRLVNDTLYVASPNANDIMLADKLGFMVNKFIRLEQHPASNIRIAIERAYRRTLVDEFFSNQRIAFGDTMASCAVDSTDFELTLDAPERPRLFGVERLDAPTAGSHPHTMFGRERMPGMDSMLSCEESLGPLPRQLARGEDPTVQQRRNGVIFYIVEEGQRVLVVSADGQMEVVVGPKRITRWGKKIRPMQHFVAHPGEFLIVRFRDGRQEHLTGPAEVWFDPRIHMHITRQDALQIAAKEAVVVYSRNDSGNVNRRLVHGPTLFVPAPGEWLHTFTWHGADGGSEGSKKVAKGLVFQKLWLMPDQMYHDVTDVRTADDAVLTIRLMMFFELIDIEKMLETTHDPIGDFINAATSDVVDFTGRHSFESFKQNTSKLNDLEAYKQLSARAAQCGYRINKVVYRGYGAPERLQAMHDQAIEARTKLQLERATEQQAQELEDYKLAAQITRAAKRRTEQATEVQAELELSRQRQEADLRQRETAHASAREQRRADTAADLEMRAHAEMQHREHLAILALMGVDLTAYLTQSRADRVIELRGGNVGTHLHLDRVEANGTAE